MPSSIKQTALRTIKIEAQSIDGLGNYINDDFERSVEQIQEAGKTANLSEAIKHVAFGEITKLELLHFVLFLLQ